jgi:hypothetical protein
MEIWWKCCLNGGGYINVQYYNPGGVDAPGRPKKLQSQFFRPNQKSCDWSVTNRMFFVFQKYFGQPPFWTFIGHVAYMLRKWQHFHQCPKMGVCTEWVDGGGWMNQDFNQKNSNFKRNIFGRKVSFRMFSYGSNQDFYNLNIPISNRIFLAEKCVSHNFRWFQPGLYNLKYSNFKPNIFGWKVSFHMFSYGSNQDFYN